MPRKSTVSKSTATAPKAPRKTRTRKTATVKTVTSKTVKPAPVAKPVAKKVTVTTFQGGKVIAKKTTLKRPGTSKLITPQRYMADIATRWAIHNYEIQELLKDFSKGFEIVKPYHAQVVKMLNNWALGVKPLFFLPVLVLPFKCRSHKQLGFIGYKRVRFPLQANQTFAYFQMATDYTAALDLVEYFQDCQNGGEILDTIDAVFMTAEDN